jgi:hypothetical protein
MIYDNKAYFCEIAAAFDRLKIGAERWQEESSGWDITDDKYVFNKTDEEILEQAAKFCWQCGWPLKPQKFGNTIISPTNRAFLEEYGVL